MNVSSCLKHDNLEHALQMAEEAVFREAEFLVFPEVFSTGFCYDRIEEVAEDVPGLTIEKLCDFSKEHDCILAGSMIERRNKDTTDNTDNTPSQYNLGFCIESGKLAGSHRKVQLYGPEKDYFASGDSIAPIKLKKHNLSVGLIICNEIRYPEVARKLAVDGADIFVSSAEIPDFYSHPWRIMSISRAIENQLPHVACNRAGEGKRTVYHGGSLITDGWGRIVEEAGKEESVLIGQIDLDNAKKIKQNGSILQDMRTDLY
jgi:predicted amidohydrolase